MTSPELTGGAGFTYEDAVTAYYLVALVGGTTAAGLTSRVVERVAQQQADFGEPLDDVIVDVLGQADGTAMRMSLQVKRELTISSAPSNRDFREVIQRSWETLQKPDFREHVDRVGAITSSVAEETFRSFTTVCEWARASDTVATFMLRFADGGNAAASHRAVAEAVRQATQDSAAGSLSDDQLYRLFQHLTLIRFDFLQAGSTHEAEAVASLQRTLVAGQVERAGDLWNQLRQLARDGAGRSAAHTKASVLRVLVGWRFNSAPARAADMQNLRESTSHWLTQQSDDIGGMHLNRQPLRDKLAAEMETHRLTLIKGLPGTGKTVLLRDLVQRLATDGTTLFLTANRLAGRSWAEHARATGLSITSIEPLLVEVAATGHAMLFIDGLDRIAPEQRAVVTDLLGQLLTNPALAGWRVVATARDAGIEPLRNWVPAGLLVNGGVGYVDVENLSSEEAISLAETLPALRSLLTGGDERVRTLARRPFFAAVLARGFSRAAYPADFAPRSEVELVDAWWSRGGYDSQAPQAFARQRALVELAQHSAPDLGRNMRLRDLSATTQAVLPALEEDGLVQQVRIGHTAQFSHDIFFEWSFLHLLLDQGSNWIDTLTTVGEPPALARVVELLSQATYSDREQWPRQLHVLEQVQVRPQWLRAWLVAPVFGSRFAEQVDMFSATLTANEHRLFGKLLVWMQAEKTTPNPLVLSGQLGSDDLEPTARIRLADLLGWPSDFLAWRRLLLCSIPDAFLPDLVTLFETWQVATADFPNPVSQRIVSQCVSWLQAIDDQHLSWRFRRTNSGNDAEPRPRAPTNLQTELRALVLRTARAYPDIVNTYLARSAQLPSRQRELRDLIPYFVLGSDIAIRDACRAALDDFPNRLEFAYEEEVSDANYVAGLRHTAELWSELGHIENYSTSPVPGRNDIVQISVNSPRHEAPEVQAARRQHVQISREMELWLWVEKCFSSSKWAPGFTPDEAVARAMELTAARANGQAQSLMPGSGFTDGAIAGTAAAITCYCDVTMHSEWAATTIDHYRTTADEVSEETFSGSIIPWHPKIFVAHALAARIRTGNGQQIDCEALYRLVTHPLEVVSLAALTGIASCWERDQRFAWSGLNLGLRLAQLLPWRDAQELSPEARRAAEDSRRNAALAAALNEYQATGALSPWVTPLRSWVRTPPITSRRRRRADGDEEWQRSEDVWHSQYAANILKLVPVAAVMTTPTAATKYVDAMEALVAWTLDTLSPSWRTEGRRGRERDDTNLFEWQHQLGRSLAHVALQVSEPETRDRLLSPLLEQPDEIAMQLLEPFAEMLVCAGIFDAAKIQEGTLQLLSRVLERTLEHDDLQRSPYNAGRVGGFDLPELVKSLLFVSVEQAPAAARFANGQWADLAQVMPLIDRMIRQAGWNPYVARQFVTLCQRADGNYPADTFADQILAQIVDGRLPSGWKGTTVPAAIAALVQAHADRQHPLPTAVARKLLQVLDALIDLGDRRSAALQQSESFRGVRLAGST